MNNLTKLKLAVVSEHARQTLRDRYQQVRQHTDQIAAALEHEDCVIQSMPDVSPTRWHLAHTTWFFETFMLRGITSYRPFRDEYEYLFNSYYNTVGEQFPRTQRGLLSRPTVQEILDYRQWVDQSMVEQLSRDDLWTPELLDVLEVGLNHEQQHQELMLTDIKHVLSCNPIKPALLTAEIPSETVPDQKWIEFAEGLHRIGHEGNGFAFDNESPRHRVFVESFELSNRLVTNGEFLQFIDDGGYLRPDYWLSLGWSKVVSDGWTAPLYWSQHGDRWQEFTLGGLRSLDLSAPVTHISYLEADAFARSVGARLPTEAEWEIAASPQPTGSEHGAEDFFDDELPVHPAHGKASNQLHSMFGSAWQWTASSYAAYPGYRPAGGALGEYNGKFMCNQYVLRGSSCATPRDHSRKTYRNFFPPEARWQFTGIRLAR